MPQEAQNEAIKIQRHLSVLPLDLLRRNEKGKEP